MSRKYDVAIIGSGLGGLVTANFLSKKGYEVCVIERNSYAGGCLHSFEKDGDVFDTGIHYVGGFSEGQVLHKIFSYLGILPELDLRKMDPQGFDRIFLGDKEYAYVEGYENFKNSLLKSFPAEEQAIDSYLGKIKEIADSVPLYNLQPFEFDPSNFFSKFDHGNAWDFIKSTTENNTLRQVFAALNTLYAGSPDNAFLYIHALINNHYLQGAWRFIDGSKQVADLLVKKLEENGGKVFTGKRINRLKGDAKKIEAAIAEDGDEFLADKFISTLHPFQLMEILDEGTVRKGYRRRLQNLPNTMSSFCLYLAFKDGEVPYMNHNRHHHPSENVWGLANYDPAKFPQGFGFYPTADSKDEKYLRTASAISFMDFKEVEKWAHTTLDERGDDYKNFKIEKTQIMLEQVENAIPEIKGKVKYCFGATPLTLRDYTATHRGATYGILRDSRNPNEAILFPNTRVPNLFLTGQNLSLHGMMGTTLAALLTSGLFCDLNQLIKDINDA